MTTTIQRPGTDPWAIMEQVIVKGDLAALTEQERVQYYRQVCESVGLNPLTRPFEYIVLDNRLTLYARKDAADQLRDMRGISIIDVTEAWRQDLYIVTVKAQTADGRTDISKGVVALVREGGTWETGANNKRYFKKNGTLEPLPPGDLANAIMKAETKAKRRVTLSICGLGFLDETEVESIPTARRVQVNPDTGEIADPRPTEVETSAREVPADDPKPRIDAAARRIAAVLRRRKPGTNPTWGDISLEFASLIAPDVTSSNATPAQWEDLATKLEAETPAEEADPLF